MLSIRLGVRRLSTAMVKCDVRGKVAVLTLSNPGKMNALTAAMGDQLGEVTKALDFKQVGAVVVTGEGNAFSAGGDFGFLTDRSNDTGSRNTLIMRQFYRRFLSIRDLPVPVLACINGPAIGAGLCFALGADIRIASKSAKLGVTFVGLGLHPGMGCTYTLPRLVGPQIAARLLLTGDVVSGEEAAKLGLVLEAVEDAEALPRTIALADRIAAQAPVAVRGCVRSLRMAHDEGFDKALHREADAQSYCYSGPDFKEGLQAVSTKRKPVWTQYESYTD